MKVTRNLSAKKTQFFTGRQLSDKINIMTTPIPDFSKPPQWVLDMHDPDSMPSHVFVTESEDPDSYVIQEIDFHVMNPYTVSLAFDLEFPVKGKPEVFVGSKEGLYERLQSLHSEVILSRSVSKLIADGYLAPMAYGHASGFDGPALVCGGYKAFLQAQEAYEKNPEQAGPAYEFINQHPMFWHKTKTRRGEIQVVTGQGWHSLQWLVLHRKNKETGAKQYTVTIETGPGSYHDYNLDVYAPSFDAAIIEMAKLIHKHYDSHGGFTDKTKKEPNDNFFSKNSLDVG
jgi:hypothetical protein